MHIITSVICRLREIENKSITVIKDRDRQRKGERKQMNWWNKNYWNQVIFASFLDNEVLLLVVIHTNWTKRGILNIKLHLHKSKLYKVIEAVAARPSDWNGVNLKQVSAISYDFVLLQVATTSHKDKNIHWMSQ